jgi:hypothetical protein
MPGILLDGWARPLVLLHAAAAIVLVGASTHHAIVAWRYLRGRYPVRLGRIYAVVSAIAYGATMVLGALAYPTFRYHVRGLYFDHHAPWASNLFDIKENLASIGLPLVVGALVLSRVLDPRADRPLVVGYAVMVIGVAGIVWFGVASGLLVTLVKGV